MAAKLRKSKAQEESVLAPTGVVLSLAYRKRNRGGQKAEKRAAGFSDKDRGKGFCLPCLMSGVLFLLPSYKM